MRGLRVGLGLCYHYIQETISNFSDAYYTNDSTTDRYYTNDGKTDAYFTS